MIYQPAILRLSPYTTVTRVAIFPRGSRWRWKVHGSYLEARPGVAPADHDSVERESEFRHEDPARSQASESSTHTDTTCAYTIDKVKAGISERTLKYGRYIAL